jgi:hypothetical protein
VSCSLPKHCGNSDSSEQNPTNFDMLFAMSLYGIWPFKGLTAQRYMSFSIKEFG